MVIGKIEDLNRTAMVVGQLNLQKYAEIPTGGLDSLTKVRYKDSGTIGHLVQDADKIKVEFTEEVAGIAPGQAAVFYEGGVFAERVKFVGNIGGGVWPDGWRGLWCLGRWLS